MKYILILCLLFLTACLGPVKPSIISGNNLSTEHGTARIKDALMGAQGYCSSIGKNVKLIRTDCPGRCVSSFECIQK